MPGVITYTQWLNDHGRLEADLTVTKLDDDRFWVVATDTAHRHVETLDAPPLRTTRTRSSPMSPRDTHSSTCRARARASCCSRSPRADMSNEAFPFRAAREIDIGFARALCVRITYLGELGYELYVPAEQAVHVYDRIVAAGAALGLRHAGLKALGSLRMEKGYRDYGHDIDNTDSVLEAGLGFAVDLDKPGGFIGREAVHRPQGRRPAAPSAPAGAGRRSGAADVPRRSPAPQRLCGRLRARRVVRVHTRWGGRAGDAGGVASR